MLILADAGNSEAIAKLYDVAEPELRKIARGVKRRISACDERTTVIIDDAFMKLLRQPVSTLAPGDREKVFAYAAKMMHDLVIDDLRRRMTGKRGKGAAPAAIENALFAPAKNTKSENLEFQLDLMAGLAELQTLDREAAIVFRIKYLLSCTFEEIAEMLGAKNVAEVVKAHGRARAWLRGKLRGYDLES